MQSPMFAPVEESPELSSSGKMSLVSFPKKGTPSDAFLARREAGPVHPTLTASGGGSLDDREAYVLESNGVRRTTPVEWERCQGFPDDYTMTQWRGRPASESPDGPRYKAIGNSKAGPVVRWIGRRIF